jgi:hypothetical protein
MDTTDNTINNIYRAHNLISHEMGLAEVGDAMVSSGVSPEDAFLAFHAAKILLRDTEQYRNSKFYHWLDGCDE